MKYSRSTIVNEQPPDPVGLNEPQLQQLTAHVQRSQLLTPERLLQTAYAHLEDLQSARTKCPQIDTALAQSICRVLDRLVSEWDCFSPTEQSWLRGVLRYFTTSDDKCHDFQLGGLRDDVEVLNASLRFVQREAWILPLDPESR
ncbi:MAG: hypothetical protein ACODAD_06435 [Planctomycetota bacterium]